MICLKDIQKIVRKPPHLPYTVINFVVGVEEGSQFGGLNSLTRKIFYGEKLNPIENSLEELLSN